MNTSKHKTKSLIIANWKMNLSPKDSVRLAKEFVSLLKNYHKKNIRSSSEIVLCPSFSALVPVYDIVRKSSSQIKLGAQNCFWANNGAYTGEESAFFLETIGVSYILVGHSERRTYLGETDEMVEKKVQATLSCDSLVPVICVGEKKEERAGTARKRVISSQLERAISPLRRLRIKPQKPFVIAYEPVWAIGTGTPCTPTLCAEMYSFIRDVLARFVGARYVSKWCKVLYGGSVSEKNINDFVVPGVSDGALVGGASLDAREFYNIVRAVV